MADLKNFDEDGFKGAAEGALPAVVFRAADEGGVAMLDSIRATLFKLLNEEPFDVKKLRTIERVAKASCQVLIALDEKAGNALDALVRKGNDNVDDGQMVGYGGGFETFGSKTIRELVEAIPQILRMQKETPETLVRSIAEARINGMTDVAEALEEKLLGKKLEGTRPVIMTANVQLLEPPKEVTP